MTHNHDDSDNLEVSIICPGACRNDGGGCLLHREHLLHRVWNVDGV